MARDHVENGALSRSRLDLRIEAARINLTRELFGKGLP
jgi:hypothetical protein